MNIRDILTKGFFPKELPPPFHTRSFGNAISDNLGALPDEFNNIKSTSIPATHNLARAGALRRKLSIPNPINFYRLAKFIDEKNIELTELSRRSTFSLTCPGTQAEPRAINPRNTLASGPLERAKLRSNSMFILKADISRFYHSIYSHSIPWAIHTKPVSKTNRTPALIGNALDQLVRNAQDGQTIGIPIGPDTSLLIAEIILGAVDKKISSDRELKAFRYIDDYEFGFKSYAEAENILGLLQEELNNFELSLNPRKTKISKLPIRIEKKWVSELRAFTFRTTDKGQESDLLRYFDHVFDVVADYPDEDIMKYAIGRLNGIVINEKNWALFQNLLAQCSLIEPGVLKFVINQLARYFQSYQIDKTIYEECFNQLIYIHAPLGHGSEVAWAIFSLILLSLPIHSKVLDMVSAMEDPIVATLALDAQNKKLTPHDYTFSHFATHMTTPDLHGDHWLLAYEANVKGWLPPNGPGGNVEADSCFSFLKNANVSFFDSSITLDAIKTVPLSYPPGGAGGGIY